MDWQAFFDAQAGREVRAVLKQALEFRADGGFGLGLGAGTGPGAAIDLGCGEGTDTRYLLANGWRVHAIDAAPGTAERVAAGVPSDQVQRLTVEESTFEDIRELPQADLIYAGFALPFCDPHAFSELWQRIRGSLTPGGWFAGELFGPHDEWCGRSGMNFHSPDDLKRLLSGMTVAQLVEDDRDGNSYRGPKHWHVFHIVARNPPAPE